MCVELKEWLNKQRLSEYKFAQRYKISQPYLNQLVNGRRRAGTKTIRFIEEVTGGAVNRKHLRPDIWGDTDERPIA